MGKQTLYLLQYNNYYNRIVKKYDTLTEYLTNEAMLATYDEINFIPNDGVSTEHILKYSGLEEPDYLLVYDNDLDTLSRWFIIEAIRERGGQYRFILRRDLIADNLDAVANAAVFVEKGVPTGIDDPAIFNNENMSFNQIKTSESMITDETRIGWVVGYVPRDAFETDKQITVSSLLPTDADYTVSRLADWEYYNIVGKQYPYSFYWKGTYQASSWANLYSTPLGPFMDSFIVDVAFNGTELITDLHTQAVGKASELEKNPIYDNYIKYSPVVLVPSGSEIDKNNTFVSLVEGSLAAFKNNNTLNSYIQATIPNFSTSNVNYKDLDGKIIYDESSKLYWRVKATPKTVSRGVLPNTASGPDFELLQYAGTLIDFSKALNLPGNRVYKKGKTLEFATYSSYYEISLEQVFQSISFTIPNRDRRTHLVNAPYDMFCIPYGSISIRDSSDITVPSFISRPSIAVSIGQQIGSAVAAGELYDIQLLPYCPCRHLINFNTGYLQAFRDSSSSTVLDANDDKVSVVVWCTENNINIEVAGISSDLYPKPSTTIENKKIRSETSMWRLVSPNYASNFEFNVEKNNGITAWDITCTYKPYNPYIKVSPRFAGLYGSDFNDARGLICGGDFSLARLTDAWENFELSNKNYQAVFDRQIENMEVNNAVQREQQIWNIATGAVGAATSGAMTGAMVGGGPGAAIGGVVAGAASLAGGIRDYQLSETLRNEAIDYSKDQFGYSLQNIKALPYGLSKVGAFNANNKIFPFLEYYTCTDIEKQALKDKLKYNGYTIMRIGAIGQFIGLSAEPVYIKGKLIRLEGIGDYHTVNAIAGELDKGVFI